MLLFDQSQQIDRFWILSALRDPYLRLSGGF